MNKLHREDRLRLHQELINHYIVNNDHNDYLLQLILNLLEKMYREFIYALIFLIESVELFLAS